MSRIARAFERARDERRAALVAYLMAGDPDATRHLEYAQAVLREADVLEIGIPYSDPVADGPVIERAAARALERGAKLSDALLLAKALRDEEPEKPILLMGYYNPLLQRGLARFARECRASGVDGAIVPDLPMEESGACSQALATEGIDLVQLASPASGPERLARLAKATRGFLYVVSSFGVTGARAEMAAETSQVVARAAAACRGVVPFAVGFGVSEPRHVRALAEAGAPGVVVGSAIVRRIEEGETPASVGAFVRSLRAG